MDTTTKKYLDKKFTNIDKKFTNIDKKFTSIDKKFTELVTKVDFDLAVSKLATKDDLENLATMTQRSFLAADTRFDILEEKVDGVDERLTKIEIVELQS